MLEPHLHLHLHLHLYYLHSAGRGVTEEGTSELQDVRLAVIGFVLTLK